MLTQHFADLSPELDIFNFMTSKLSHNLFVKQVTDLYGRKILP